MNKRGSQNTNAANSNSAGNNTAVSTSSTSSVTTPVSTASTCSATNVTSNAGTTSISSETGASWSLGNLKGMISSAIDGIFSSKLGAMSNFNTSLKFDPDGAGPAPEMTITISTGTGAGCATPANDTAAADVSTSETSTTDTATTETPTTEMADAGSSDVAGDDAATTDVVAEGDVATDVVADGGAGDVSATDAVAADDAATHEIPAETDVATDADAVITTADDLPADVTDPVTTGSITPVVTTPATPTTDTATDDQPEAATTVTDETITAETTAQDCPVEETPVAEVPVAETPVAEAPVDEAPVEETPVAQTPVEETPVAEDCPVEEVPEHDVSGNGQGWGDPHFVGADGEKYDVQGEAGKTYNLLSDRGFQVNADFSTYAGNMNVMTKLGVTAKGNQIEIGTNAALTINGQTYEQDGAYLDGMVTRNGGKVTVKTDEYTVAASGGSYLDVTFSGQNVQRDGVMPTGIWGVTLDGDGKPRLSGGAYGTEGGSMQGGGVLEKADGSISDKDDVSTYKEYEVTNLMDLMFPSHNRYAA
ncbi:MAG: hypothetical protein ACRCWO_07240 [Bosea sp. (in: a-proteobacteria)]